MSRRVVTARTLGFTGTRAGMTYPQFRAVCRLLVDKDGPAAVTGVEVVRHGDATWADADIARIARWVAPAPRVVAHPRVGDAKRAHAPADAVEPAATPLDRSRAVIGRSDVLLACPAGPAGESRSGTWGTVRYARTLGRQVVVVLPNGTVSVDGPVRFLVVDWDRRPAVHVFLCRPPRADGFAGVTARAVVLDELPLAERGRVPAARPALGFSPADPDRFREFRSRAELTRAGYEPAGRYRVCNGWDDYHFPWGLSESPAAAAVPSDGQVGMDIKTATTDARARTTPARHPAPESVSACRARQ